MKTMNDIFGVLKDTFGLESFLEGQKEVVESVLRGNDTIVFMPTGGGKSLTYQLPGVILPGIALVISPLISLMKDQIDKLNRIGIRAEVINSTVSMGEQSMIFDELSGAILPEKPIRFLYIAPERLNSSRFMHAIEGMRISLVAVDEAHCISQWGHDFRPSYLKIQDFLETLKQSGSFPVIALTATATKRVREDIVQRLGLQDPTIFTKGFDRKNIIIIVKEISAKEEKLNKVLEVLSRTPGSGIIYCSSRKMVDEVYGFLLRHGISAGMYTGAMSAESRERMQNAFMEGEFKAIVATNAFGMGIDKKDIRFVIHYNLPGSIENYYQEVGRAGRDGKNAYGIVLASYGDTKIQEYFIGNTHPEEHEITRFYDYLYRDSKLCAGGGILIQKTYATMAKESGIGDEMRIGSILKILEKYGIVSRGIEGDPDEGFRGKGVTLLQDKRKPSEVPIDWKRQQALKQEASYKLEQIKELLFSPRCRKRFILEYFGDEEDLSTLGERCGFCDYCIDKKKLAESKKEHLVNLSVFGIVLDAIKAFDGRFGVKTMDYFLRGHPEKRLVAWGLTGKRSFGVLKEYSPTLVLALIESLIRSGFLEKTSGAYPLLRLTEAGMLATKKEVSLKKSEEDLQSYIALKVKDRVFSTPRRQTKMQAEQRTRSHTKATSGIDTYSETLALFQSGCDIKQIALERGMSSVTIEGHLVKLYEDGLIPTEDIRRITNTSDPGIMRTVIGHDLKGDISKLKPIKEALEASGHAEFSYLDIKLCLVMMKRDGFLGRDG